MNYIGEDFILATVGKLAIWLSFTASILALVGYIKALQAQKKLQPHTDWLQIGRLGYYIQAICIVVVFGTLLFALINHKYEFAYVFNHSSNELEKKYLLSCFWEGMEGSFLLWSFWNAVLGTILTRTAKNWEAPVMIVFAATQIITASFTLGIYIADVKIGSNPFVLLRHESALPLFNNPNYLAKLKNGSGLNALLQNYWMVIHPPVLFLGFSSVLVPFAYAIGSLLLGNYKDWVKPAFPWALISTGILGLGIMMGAIWAYESLTFGGFWAWDPVENASMVPWVVAVAGVHTALIYKNTGRSLMSTYIFVILAYVLVLYSSFLTKSGILQNSSVHAFTDKNASIKFHLLFKVLIYLVLPAFLLVKHYKNIPKIKKEEQVSSREFWMFIGSLVFFASGLIIIIQTSWPALSSMLSDTPLAMGQNQEYQYNKVQIWVAIIAGLLTAITQYLKYKSTTGSFFWKNLLGPTIAALIISIAISTFGNVNYLKHGADFLIAIHLGIYMAVYTVVANSSFIFSGLKGRIKFAGGSIAHVGFGLLLLGIIIASAKKTVVSYDTTLLSKTYIQETENEKANENITLIKGLEVPIGKNIFSGKSTFKISDTLAGHKYVVKYSNKYDKDNKTFFDVNFKNIVTGESFVLSPDVIQNNKGAEGVSPNPDSKHYWNKDLFAYLTYISEPSAQKDTSKYVTVALAKGDSLPFSKGFISLQEVNVAKGDPTNANNPPSILPTLKITAKTGETRFAKPKLQLVGNNKVVVEDTVAAYGLFIRVDNVDEKSNKLLFQIKESALPTEFILLKVYEFPFINLVWFGTLLIVFGFILSAVQRIKQLRRNTKLA
jgi:cytochrome c-type biogenesis protein CcmF